jgi:hypothetical protein
VEVKDPLEEINLGCEKQLRPTYISSLSEEPFKSKLIDLLSEFKDCFSWEYEEMSGLSKDIVEHRLPIIPRSRIVKQAPRRFAPDIILKIKKVERL